jgi:hypothetical protein
MNKSNMDSVQILKISVSNWILISLTLFLFKI